TKPPKASSRAQTTAATTARAAPCATWNGRATKTQTTSRSSRTTPLSCTNAASHHASCTSATSTDCSRHRPGLSWLRRRALRRGRSSSITPASAKPLCLWAAACEPAVAPPDSSAQDLISVHSRIPSIALVLSRDADTMHRTFLRRSRYDTDGVDGFGACAAAGCGADPRHVTGHGWRPGGTQRRREGGRETRDGSAGRKPQGASQVRRQVDARHEDVDGPKPHRALR